MSTKIYWAYQVPYGQYPAFVEEVREHVQTRAVDRLAKLLQAANIDEQREFFHTYLGTDETNDDVGFDMRQIGMMLRFSGMDPDNPTDATCFMYATLSNIRSAAEQSKRNPLFDLESILIAHAHDGDYYIQHQGAGLRR